MNVDNINCIGCILMHILYEYPSRVKIAKLRTSEVTRKLEIQTVTRGYV